VVPLGWREWGFLQEESPYSKEIADLPLGIISGTAYSQAEVQLARRSGSALHRRRHQITQRTPRTLGLDGLLEMLRGLRCESASEAGAALVEGVARFRGSVATTDDETVVALYRRPRAEVRG
jgi:hypothetical protein